MAEVKIGAEYNEDSIRSLDWKEHIRLRPGMYIGKLGDGTAPDDGIYVLIKEVIDNCIDEHTMGHGKSVDIVLCNPPFHQQHAVTGHIASQMFTDAKRVLKQGGRLRIVANRHLGYADVLKRLFGNCQQLAADPKFVILEAIKRS